MEISKILKEMNGSKEEEKSYLSIFFFDSNDLLEASLLWQPGRILSYNLQALI